MLYTLIALVVILIAGYLGFQSIKFLWLRDWFLGWLRGMFGLLMLVLTTAIGLIGQPIATINFDQVEEQYYDVLIVDANGEQHRFNVHGDQWQLDTRIIKWKGYFSGFAIKPAYRLDRLSGRYYDITKETTAKRSAFVLFSSPLQLDLWRLINERPNWFSVLDANCGTANYLPMRNGAQYEISLTSSGIQSRPLNDVARKAVAEWK
jgi:hypothetical protein